MNEWPPELLDKAERALLNARATVAVHEARRYQPILAGRYADYDQCLPIACETVLRLPRGTLPPIREGKERHGWFQQAGLRTIDVDEIPPEDGKPWIAVIKVGKEMHAVPMRGFGMVSFHTVGESWNLTPDRVQDAFMVEFT